MCIRDRHIAIKSIEIEFCTGMGGAELLRAGRTATLPLFRLLVLLLPPALWIRLHSQAPLLALLEPTLGSQLSDFRKKVEEKSQRIEKFFVFFIKVSYSLIKLHSENWQLRAIRERELLENGSQMNPRTRTGTHPLMWSRTETEQNRG